MLDRLVGYRINRLTYAIFSVFIVGVVTTLRLLDLAPPFLGPVSLAALVVISTVRLHDIGKSSGLASLTALTLIMVELIGRRILALQIGAELVWLTTVLALVAMVWLGAIKGDPNANTWGDPPPSGISWKRPAG